MDKITVIDNRVYIDVESYLDSLFDVCDRLTRVNEHAQDIHVANQVLGIVLVANALEEILTAHKP